MLQFTVGRLDLSNGGLPAPHLREHLVSGVPITVFYYGTEVIRYIDTESARVARPQAAPSRQGANQAT